MKEKILPRTPSLLIRLALADLRKVERSKKYKVNMDVWVKPNGVCQVCLAGSVMAKTLKVTPVVAKEMMAKQAADRWCGSESDLGAVPEGINISQLSALNSLREGHVMDAFEDLNLPYDLHDDLDREIPAYTPAKKEKFHAAMHKLADDLEAHGW